MNSCAIIGCSISIFILIIIGLSGIALLSLEIEKIILFNKTNGELKVNAIDYVYLTYLICGGVYGGCRSSNESEKNCCANICAFILSITIYVLYNYLTINEMGDIPFFCPPDYPYSSPLIRKACQVRAANLLLSWIISGIWLIVVLFACCYFIVVCLTSEKSDESNNV
ncbi:hypothetical protein GLOIN_2v1495096 [Rhizophagus clarus]|uniref:Uncharacterized protein n=1 Tax=Rhizophagus clarus TaxID=94130 RepID=A0A8H3QWR5_9GLOM|nr:hypothetical protein GLOIN_2v1495096 [Rhizophagus clarus]